MYFKKSSIVVIAGMTVSLLSQQTPQDPGSGGVPIELVHLHNNEYLQGIAVSSTGRKFFNYARSPGPNNIAYTVAELAGNDTETHQSSATLYFSAVGSRNLYSTPTARLLDDSLTSELMATQAVVSHRQQSKSDGLKTKTNAFIYGGNWEDKSIVLFNPPNRTVNVFARDLRMSWTDTLLVATDGCIYFSENQL